MRHGSAAAFKSALEARIKRAAGQDSESIVRLRRLIAADRLMARLLEVEPEGWIIKGGMALDLRFGNHARMTRDLDLARADSADVGLDVLLAAADTDLNDYFSFTISRSRAFDDDDNRATRYQVFVELGGTLFERMTLDVGLTDTLPDPPDRLTGIRLLEFADIDSIVVPAIPLAQHLAEKVHAYTRTYAGGRQSSRVKDLVDIVVIIQSSSLVAGELRAAIEQIFFERGTHGIPARLPAPPDAWRIPYRELAGRVHIASDITGGYARAAACFDPVLSGVAASDATWDQEEGWS